MLRNKKTGEIGYLVVSKGSDRYTVTNDEWDNCGEYTSLSELNEEWEDYEEPKYIWWLDSEGHVYNTGRVNEYCFERSKEIGNFFETKEEAEKAVEKLKAWARLKYGGVKFELASIASDDTVTIFARFPNREKFEDLNGNLFNIFGGEE